MPKGLGCPTTSKQMKVWIEWKNLSSEVKESLYLKLLACWEFNLGQFRVFWKTAWTCVRLLPSLCPAPAHSALFVHEFWAKTKMTVIPHPPYLPNLAPVTSFFSQNWNGVESKEIKWYHHDSGRIAGCTCWVSNTAIYTTLQILVCFLGLLYKVPRRLL